MPSHTRRRSPQGGIEWTCPPRMPGRAADAVPRGTCRRGAGGSGKGRAATGGPRRVGRRSSGSSEAAWPGRRSTAAARIRCRRRVAACGAPSSAPAAWPGPGCRLSADSLAVRGLFNDLSPPLLGTLFSNDAAEDERFFDRLDSPFGDGHTRWWTVSSRSATRTRLVHLAARTPVRSGRGAGRGRHLLDSAPLLDRRRHDVARRIDEVRTTRASSTALTLMMNY